MVKPKRHKKLQDLKVQPVCRDMLLRWAQETTANYPGVNVVDFNDSWRDVLAFNAIYYHMRNGNGTPLPEKPEMIFEVIKRVYGIPVLISSEAIHTGDHIKNEGLLIKYITLLYNAFLIHKSDKQEKCDKYDEYKKLANSFLVRIDFEKNKAITKKDNLPNTIDELKKVAKDSIQLLSKEGSLYQDRNKLFSICVDISKKEVEPDSFLNRWLFKFFRIFLHIIWIFLRKEDQVVEAGRLEECWEELLLAHHTLNSAIGSEIGRLEGLGRKAEKVLETLTELKSHLDQMDELAIVINQTLADPNKDTALNCFTYFGLLTIVRKPINSTRSDLQILKDGGYTGFKSLDEKFQVICHRQSIDFCYLNDDSFLDLWKYFEWIPSQLTEVKKKQDTYGNDIPSVEADFDYHLEKHKKVVKLATDLNNWYSNVQMEQMSIRTRLTFDLSFKTLIQFYYELHHKSSKRLYSLRMILDIFQSITEELNWISEKMETEISRDFTGTQLEYNNFKREAKRRRYTISYLLLFSFKDCVGLFRDSVHPLRLILVSQMAQLQSKMDLLSPLKLCWKAHLPYAPLYRYFYMTAEEYGSDMFRSGFIRTRLDNLSCEIELDIEVAKEQLQELQRLQGDLVDAFTVVEELYERRNEVVPLWKRRQPLANGIVRIESICGYPPNAELIKRGDYYQLVNNAPNNDHEWEIITFDGVKRRFPSVCFTIPLSLDEEAIRIANQLKDHYDEIQNTWFAKQLLLMENVEEVIQLFIKADSMPERSQDDRLSPIPILQVCEEIIILCDPNTQVLQRAVLRSLKFFYTLVEKAEFDLTIVLGDFAFPEIFYPKYNRIEGDYRRRLGLLEKQLKILLKIHHDVKLEIEWCPRVTSSMGQKYNHCMQKYNILREHLQLIIDGFDGIEKMVRHECMSNSFVLKEKLASPAYFPSEPVALRMVYDELVAMQKDLPKDRIILDEVQEILNKVQQLFAHRNIDGEGIGKIEADIQSVILKWDDNCAQLNERILACQKALIPVA